MDMLEDDKQIPIKYRQGWIQHHHNPQNMAAPSSASVSTATASCYESTESFSSAASSKLS